MNKIFKVIWSEARNAYVVVSEIAKNMGSKSCSTKKLLAMLIATGVMTCAGMAPVMAANLAPNDAKIEIGKDAVVHSESGIAIGDGAEVGTQGFLPYYGIAIGKDARSITYSISIGSESYSNHYSVAIGESARAEGSQDVAIGYGAKSGVSSVAIGCSANAQWNSVAIGIETKAKGQLSIAIGPGAQTGGQEGQTEEEPLRAIAIGNQAKARQNITTAIGYEAEANDQLTTAIGYQAKANTIGSIAFGNETTAEGQHAIAIGTRAKTGSMFAVALGHEAEASDQMAIALGNQAKAKAAGGTALGVEAHAYGIQTVALGYQAQAQADQAIALGNVATASGKQAIAVGYYATASGEQATALGKNAKATGKNTLALGTSAKATTEDAEANIENAIAIGANSKASAKNAAALGNTALATGESAIALGDNAKAQAGQATALGGNATANGLNSTALGAQASAAGTQATAVGHRANASGEHATAIGYDSAAGVSGSVALGNYSVANRESGITGYLAPDNANSDLTWTANQAAVSVGALVKTEDGTVSQHYTRQITNVAAGSEDTDAVNVAQLKKAKTEVEAGNNVTIDSETDAKDGHTTYTINAKDTTYSEGNGIKIDANDGNKISVKLSADENNKLSFDKDGNLSLNLTQAVVYKDDNSNKAIQSTNAGSVADNAAIALGNKVAATGENAIAIGGGYIKDGQYISWTNATGAKSIAIGVMAWTPGENAVALGNNAHATTNNSVAIGAGSVAERAAGEVGLYAPTGTESATWKSSLGDVSVGFSSGSQEYTRQITHVAAGSADTDAVNVAQLKTAKTEVKGGSNVTVSSRQGANGQDIYTISAVDTTYTAGNGIAIDSESNNAISVKLKAGEQNLVVDQGGLSLNKTLVVNSVNAGGTVINNSGLSIGGNTYVSSSGLNANSQKIINVAAGSDDTDAVNVKQLKDATAAAGQGWKLSTNGGTATTVAPGETVDFAGDNNVSVSNDGNSVKVSLKDNISVSSITTNNAYVTNVDASNDNSVTNVEYVNQKTAAAKTEVVAGTNVASVDKTTAEDGHSVYTVNAKGTTVTGDANVEATAEEEENNVTNYKLKLKSDLTGISSISNGSSSINLSNGNVVVNNKVTINGDGKISGVAAGAVTATSTDAVNGSQLYKVASEAGKHSKVVNGTNTNVEAINQDGQMVYKVNLNSDILLGDLTGNNVNISGTKGTIETTGYIATKDRIYADKGGTLANIDVTGNKISNGSSSIEMDGSNVKVNNQVTIDQTGKISGVADGEINASSTDAINGSQLNDTNNRVTNVENRVTSVENRVTTIEGDVTNIKNDIKDIKGDITNINNTLDDHSTKINQNTQDIKSLDNRVTEVEKVAGKHSSVSEGDNITVTEGTNDKGGKDYTVALNKDINLDSVTTGDTVMNNDGLKVGSNVSVTKDAVTAGSTSISNDGLKIGEKTYVSSDGLNANSQKVTNVADGEISATSKDAVNGSQLNATNEQVINNSNRISRLGDRVNKVGAGAAALAALHPMDFDPDDKWSFAAGYGNYAGENAAAVGAYYRPDEKVMFSIGGTVGNGENMVNAGISFALDRTNHVSNSRTALAREVIDLRSQLAEMGAKMAKMEAMLGVIDESKTKLFPDVPANHWAYEYIAKLAGNGILEGYPDGTFGGDRLMTRYEFATMLYRAIEKGAALEERIINEFAPELGRIRVDRISGKDGDRNKIERVRVNGPRSERDHYGSKLK